MCVFGIPLSSSFVSDLANGLYIRISYREDSVLIIGNDTLQPSVLLETLFTQNIDKGFSQFITHFWPTEAVAAIHGGIYEETA
jgi:hypothetical protein